jgi:hypothetical protein
MSDGDSIDLSALHEAYRRTWCRLLAGAGVADHEVDRIIENGHLLYGDSQIALQLNESTGALTITADVGVPPLAVKDDVYRALLEQHFAMAAPYHMIAAVQPGSGRIVLRSYVGVPVDESQDRRLIDVLEALTAAARSLADSWSFHPG